ncbi:hypothetical protein [Zavarzinella formosa]|uniref:hypothetical protein n=1 Tax=Zavarzinella formosa TaxID=360055 RepID=UPI0002EA4C4D|nr:hypothetical protein [Zavarzinella formosa]
MKSESLQRITDFKRQMLRDFLAQCTEPQVSLFNQMYVSVEVIPESKMDWAIQQCERTVIKNQKKMAGSV